jgi:hypothetical protein
VLQNSFIISESGVLKCYNFVSLKEAWTKLGIYSIFTDRGFVQIKDVARSILSSHTVLTTSSGRVLKVGNDAAIFTNDKISGKLIKVFVSDINVNQDIAVSFNSHQHDKPTQLNMFGNSISLSDKTAKQFVDYFLDRKNLNNDGSLLSHTFSNCFGLFNSSFLIAFFEELFSRFPDSSFTVSEQNVDFIFTLLASLGFRTFYKNKRMYSVDRVGSSELSFFFDKIISKSVVNSQMIDYQFITDGAAPVFVLINSFPVSV